MNENVSEPFDAAPVSVRVIRTLGKGRAATARLVEATYADGRTVRCVEKVFAPGRLTRAIYRICFWSPFAYQFNRDAIEACYYRRKVAASVLRRAAVEVSVAAPLYVRFDAEAPGWVLAAEHIQGRGVRPSAKQDGVTEIKQIMSCMNQARDALIEAGLTGSGWQVDPKAMVSTANLLRCNDRYTIVDLESGIPAVLVPRYLAMGVREGTLPPFDDLATSRLRRLTTEKVRDGETFLADVDALIETTLRWKESEPAPLRRNTWNRIYERLRRSTHRWMKLAWRMLTNQRFQTLVGKRSIRRSISSWQKEQRISKEEATLLVSEVNGSEVSTYARGLALHLAIKSASPMVVPAKVGGVVAAITTGNLWFLLPWIVLPLARTATTSANWFLAERSVPHRHALVVGCLPTVGTLAFPVQLFVRRPKLSCFLMRDAASRIGRNVPIYGGKDSRTEIAMIEACDALLRCLYSQSVSEPASESVSEPASDDAATILSLERASSDKDNMASNAASSGANSGPENAKAA